MKDEGREKNKEKLLCCGENQVGLVRVGVGRGEIKRFLEFGV